MPSAVLQRITLVDTPGVLSGEKQLQRGYDFTSAVSWFADRCDLILVLFDASKLDISDEFREVIEALAKHHDKIRCVLNKADQASKQQLLRVYGALMWAMGKVTRTPEVMRVYVGSFWDQPLQHTENADLFEAEECDLLNDLRKLPKLSAVRKINELVKRLRQLRVHVYIISYLKSQMPALIGKEKKQKKLIANLGDQFRNVMKK